MMHRKGLPTTKVELGSVESQETRESGEMPS